MSMRIRTSAHRLATHRLATAVAAVAVGTALLLGTTAANPSGAYWTAGATTSATAVGTGQWCVAPDTTVATNYAVKLNSISTATGTNGRVAIIPVANNPAWGGGSTTGALTIKLTSCQDGASAASAQELANTIRITSWAYSSTAADRGTWLSGGTIAPGSRLSPSSTLGTNLLALAQQSSLSTLLGVTPVQRYSWIVAGGRSYSNQTAAPAFSCVLLTGLICTVPLTNSSGGDDTFSQAFDPNPWDGAASVSYKAATYAVQTAAGWTTAGAGLSNCPTLSVLCTPTSASTSMTATTASDATLFGSTNGNLLQWLVVQWNATSTSTLTDDLVLQVSFT
jgi:hypothetical protein